MNLSHSLWIWVGTFLTFCIFSFLYKDNPFYKFAEHLFVGVSVGYSISISYHNVLYPDLIVPLFKHGQLLYIVPLLFGLCYFARFYPPGFMVNTTTNGISFRIWGWGRNPGDTSSQCYKTDSGGSFNS